MLTRTEHKPLLTFNRGLLFEFIDQIEQYVICSAQNEGSGHSSKHIHTSLCSSLFSLDICSQLLLSYIDTLSNYYHSKAHVIRQHLTTFRSYIISFSYASLLCAIFLSSLRLSPYFNAFHN